MINKSFGARITSTGTWTGSEEGACKELRSSDGAATGTTVMEGGGGHVASTPVASHAPHHAALLDCRVRRSPSPRSVQRGSVVSECVCVCVALGRVMAE